MKKLWLFLAVAFLLLSWGGGYGTCPALGQQCFVDQFGGTSCFDPWGNLISQSPPYGGYMGSPIPDPTSEFLNYVAQQIQQQLLAQQIQQQLQNQQLQAKQPPPPPPKPAPSTQPNVGVYDGVVLLGQPMAKTSGPKPVTKR